VSTVTRSSSSITLTHLRLSNSPNAPPKNVNIFGLSAICDMYRGTKSSVFLLRNILPIVRSSDLSLFLSTLCPYPVGLLIQDMQPSGTRHAVTVRLFDAFQSTKRCVFHYFTGLQLSAKHSVAGALDSLQQRAKNGRNFTWS
jgi:hypothetical protein